MQGDWFGYCVGPGEMADCGKREMDENVREIWEVGSIGFKLESHPTPGLRSRRLGSG